MSRTCRATSSAGIELTAQEVDGPETPHRLEDPGAVGPGRRELAEPRARALHLDRGPPERRHVGGTHDGLELELHRRTVGLLEGIHQLDAVRQVLDRLRDGHPPQRLGPGVTEQGDGARALSRVLRVVRGHLRSGGDDVRKPLLQRSEDALMDAQALAPQQRRVNGILNQGVLEDVDRVRRIAVDERELALADAIEVFSKRLVVQAGDGLDQRVRKLPPDGRPELGDAPAVAEAIEASHERPVHARGQERLVGGAIQLVAIGVETQRPRLQRCLRDLLDEERNALAPVGDPTGHEGWQRATARDLRDHLLDLASLQSAQIDGLDMGLGPASGELRTRCDAEERPSARVLAGHQIQEVERRRIGPVNVLDEKRHRCPLGGPPGPRAQDLEGARAPTYGRELLDGPFVCPRNGEEIRHQRQRFGAESRVLSEQTLQGLELGSRRRVACRARDDARVEHLDDRGERGALGERRAEALEDERFLVERAVPEAVNDARLADPRFPADDDDTVRSPEHVRPRRVQARQLLLASHERSQGPARRRFEVGARSGRPDHA